LVKIEAERILEPQLTLVNEDFKILENDEFGQKRLFGVHSQLTNYFQTVNIRGSWPYRFNRLEMKKRIPGWRTRQMSDPEVTEGNDLGRECGLAFHFRVKL